MNAGAAWAPDDDDSSEASGWFTRVAPRPGVSLEPGVSLKPDATVEPGVSLKPDATVEPGVSLEPDVSLRPDAALEPDATVEPAMSLEPDAALEPAASPTENRSRLALPFTGPGLTWLGGALLGCLVVGLGTASDLALGGGLGTVFNVTFLLGCVLVASAVRIRALAVAVVLPPLLFAAGYGLETKASGQTSGQRQMALDLATSLALQAPMLFIGTALAVAITLVRLGVHLIRR
jgi:hypothetical protein